MLQKFCCNPFGKNNHIPAARKNLQPITLAIADHMKDQMKIDVKPGQKLCPSCRKEVIKKKGTSETSTSSSDSDPEDLTSVAESVNTSLNVIGISPIKFQRIGASHTQSYAKRKLGQVQEVISKKNAAVGNLDQTQLSTTQECTNCSDYDQLMEELKQKLRVSKRPEQIQILTLAPASWSIKKTMEEFNVSKNMVRQARKLKKEY